MKVTVIKTGVDWLDIKNACRQTINAGNSEIEPTSEWKKKLLIARHSPLRIGEILIQFDDIPFYVMGHLVRHHIGCTPFVGTSRTDRTGIPREERKQTDLVSMQMILNVESILNISEKRLCNCADIETIKVWKEVLLAIKEYEPELYWASVPSGIIHGGCTEPFGDCRSCNKILANMPTEDMLDINKRLDFYNDFREGKKK